MDHKKEIAVRLSKITGLSEEETFKLLEIPPQLDMGDFAFPCFVLAKTLRKAPPMIAADIAADESLKDSVFEAKNVGPYVNFFIDRSHLASQTIKDVLSSGDGYSSSDEGSGKNVIVEFSSPNIAKPFHVGHAFTTILGNSLSRIYKKLGYNVIRMNHLGDYGTQFGKLITAFRLWGDEDKLNEDPITELLRIYVKFHEEEKNDPSLTESARENFKKLEDGCPEEVALWKRFRDMSLVVFEKLYKRLHVEFDNYNGESFYSDKIPAVVAAILRGRSDGLACVNRLTVARGENDNYSFLLAYRRPLVDGGMVRFRFNAGQLEDCQPRLVQFGHNLVVETDETLRLWRPRRSAALPWRTAMERRPYRREGRNLLRPPGRASRPRRAAPPRWRLSQLRVRAQALTGKAAF